MWKLCTWCVGVVFLGGVVVLSAAGSGPPENEYEYVGSKACKKCHLEQFKSWLQTKMARSFHVLRPNSELKPSKKTGLTADFIEEIKAAKAKAGIAPDKDYTQDQTCLKCHTTGFGKPGGYAIPDPTDRKAKRKAAALEGIGCESCHGPGSKYLEIFKEIQDKQRQYTRAELYAAGMTKIAAETCTGCHTKADNPTAGDDYKF
ncbi:MAG: cytochrome c family protein [Phycisphaerae bacterium]